jgi:MFS family permease
MKDKLLYPIKAMRLEYIPLLAVYFSVGLSALTNVTGSFFVKEYLKIDSADLIAIGIWASLPWSIKMVFGSIIDSIKIFGNNRKSYIYLGNFFIAISALLMMDHASSQIMISALGEYTSLLLTGLLSTTGVVLADIVADTMAIELTDDQKKLAEIQVLSRLALSIGAVLGAFVTGYLALTFKGSYQYVYFISLICPLIAVAGTYFTKLKQDIEITPLDLKMLGGGLLFGAVSIVSGMISKDYGTLIMFLSASAILTFMFKDVLRHINPEVKKAFTLSMLAIFLFRVTPSIGAGITWFYMEVMKFDEIFFGHVSLIGSMAALISLWFLMELIASAKIFKSILILTIIGTILSLPELLIYYDLYQYLGVSAKSLVLMDGAMSSPIANLAMVPLGVIVAKNAPKKQKAVYITVTAGLMNLALVGGDVITEILNRIFTVTRTDFTELGELMLWSFGIGLGLSIAGLILLKKGDK